MIRRIRSVIAWVGVVIAAPAFASHYDLGTIDLVPPEYVQTLAGLDIGTTEDLWKATRAPRQVARLARVLKVPGKVVREWGEFCDLLRLDGVGPKVARVLRLAGIRHLRDLSRQDPERLTSRIATINREHEILGKLPDLASVRHWVEAAKELSRAAPSGKRDRGSRR